MLKGREAEEDVPVRAEEMLTVQQREAEEILNSSYISSISKHDVLQPVKAKGYDSINGDLILGTSGALDSDEEAEEDDARFSGSSIQTNSPLAVVEAPVYAPSEEFEVRRKNLESTLNP